MEKNLKKKILASLIVGTTVANVSGCANNKESEKQEQTIRYEYVAEPCVTSLVTSATTSTNKNLTTSTVSSESLTTTTVNQILNVTNNYETVNNYEIVNNYYTQTTAPIVTSTSATTTKPVDEVVTRSDYALYQEMQDAKFCLSHYNQTLTEMIEENLKVKLNSNDKKRYDTLLEKTKKRIDECILAYELFHINEFRTIASDICSNDEYICLDDIVKMYSLLINGYCNQGEFMINNPKNYVIEDNSIIIDGVRVNNLFGHTDYVDFDDTFTLFHYYYGDYDKDTMDLMNTLQVKTFLFQVIRNAKVGFDINTRECYAYSPNKVKMFLDNRYSYLNNNYDITSWEYVSGDNCIPYYLTYNNSSYSCEQPYGSEVYNALREYDRVSSFYELLENATYVNTDYTLLKNVMVDWKNQKDSQKVR